MKVVLASGNQGKVREIGDIFSDLNIEVLSQSEFDIESPPETGDTFVQNALIKASYAVAISGLPAIADDSGLVVDALAGRPGIYSARYAGEDATDDDNIEKLLAELAGFADGERSAAFHCAAVMIYPQQNKSPLISEATWRGEILRQRSGSGGFGYDPVFFDTNLQKTGAQMSAVEKNSVSHRGKAFRELKALLKES